MLCLECMHTPVPSDWAETHDGLCGPCFQKRQEARQGEAPRKMPPGSLFGADRPPASKKASVETTDATMRSALARLATKIEDAGAFERIGFPFEMREELMLGLRNSEWLAIHKLASMIRQIATE